MVPFSLVVSWVPVSTQVLSIQGSFGVRVSTPTYTAAFWLIVNVTRGLAVAVLELLAVRTQGAPTSAAGRPAMVYVRSPLMSAPTCSLVCSDQLAALAVSPTTRLLRT